MKDQSRCEKSVFGEESRVNLVPDENFDIIDLTQTVHYEEPVGQAICQVKVSLAYLTVKFDVFLFHSIGHVRDSVLDTLETNFSWNIKNDSQIGNNFTNRKGVE